MRFIDFLFKVVLSPSYLICGRVGSGYRDTILKNPIRNQVQSKMDQSYHYCIQRRRRRGKVLRSRVQIPERHWTPACARRDGPPPGCEAGQRIGRTNLPNNKRIIRNINNFYFHERKKCYLHCSSKCKNCDSA
jgi:hypothetical protein